MFQVPKRRKKLPSSRLSLVLILTSSRPNSAESESNISDKSHLEISASAFYSKPKSLLEQQYEQKVNAIVSQTHSDDFVALDSPLESEEENLTVGNKSEDSKSVLAAKTLVDLDSVSLPDPTITPELVQDLLINGDLLVQILLRISEQFLELAHLSVLETNDLPGTELYYSFVKLALMSLHIILNRFQSKLNPQLELAVNLRIAEIYFLETEDVDRAEIFLNTALALTTRHKLDKLCMASDLLKYKILLASKAALLPKYFKDRLSFYSAKNMAGVRDLFLLLRAQSCLSTEPSLALDLLHSLTLEPKVESHVKVLGLLLEGSLLIYRGIASEAKPLLKQAATLMSTLTLPPQLRGLHLLLTLYYYIQVGDLQKGKEATKEISRFVSRQNRAGWRAWTNNGEFRIKIELSKESDVEFLTCWLNPNEYLINFYFFSGILFLAKETSYSKAEKVFQICFDLVNDKINELTSQEPQAFHFGIYYLTDHFFRLQYIRYSLIYYQCWLKIVRENDYLGISLIQALLENLNAETLSKEELSCYELLQDRFMYLLALSYLYQGDLKAAQYYLLQVRKRASNTHFSESDSVASEMQVRLGIGCEILLGKKYRSQLFLYSSIHLLLICEFELYFISENLNLAKVGHASVSSCRALLGTLYSDLGSSLNENATFGVGASEKVLCQTFTLINNLLMRKNNPTLFGSLNSLSSDIHSHSFVTSLMTFLELRGLLNRVERNMGYEKLIQQAANSFFLTLLKFLVLSESVEPETEIEWEKFAEDQTKPINLARQNFAT